MTRKERNAFWGNPNNYFCIGVSDYGGITINFTSHGVGPGQQADGTFVGTPGTCWRMDVFEPQPHTRPHNGQTLRQFLNA